MKFQPYFGRLRKLGRRERLTGHSKKLLNAFMQVSGVIKTGNRENLWSS